MTKFDFPAETDEYRQKRAKLLEAEMALSRQTEKVAELRRQLPLGMAMPDYVFREGPADLDRNDPADFTEVHLADLFTDGHDTLVVDHLMFGPGDFRAGEGEPCAMCAMWADGYNAIAPHIRQRATFVLVAKADIATLRRFAKRRGWDRIRLLSSHQSTFNPDMNMENPDGGQVPGLSVFSRGADGVVYHRYSIAADFDERTNRGIDPHSPVWNLFDLLPQGRGDWYPSHDYMDQPLPDPA